MENAHNEEVSAEGTHQEESNKVAPISQVNGTVPKTEVDDDELDSLLDDALEDFDKPSTSKSKLPASNVEDDETNDAANIDASANNPDKDPLFDALWNDDSFMKMSDGMNDMFSKMMKEDPTLMSEYKKFQDNMGDLAEGGSDGNIDENVQKTLEELTKNLQGLSTDDSTDTGMEEVLKQMQAELLNGAGAAGLDDGGLMNDGSEGGDMFMNMMQGMMTNLLSKELLYPSLKEIKEKYPSWFEENRTKISKEEFDKYKRQEDAVCKLCHVFEQEKDDDSEAVKKKRMDQIMELMQKMQECGQPPADVMADISNDFPQATPTTPTNPECSIM